MTGRLRILFLPRAAAALAVIGLTASPVDAVQMLQPPPTAQTQTQTSFLATPEFRRLVEGKSIVVTTTRGRVYEGHFIVSGNRLVNRGLVTSVSVPFEQVLRVEKSTFRMRTHALIGLGVGTTVGLLLANDACDGHCGSAWFHFAALGGGIGAGIGARNGAKLDGLYARYGDANTLFEIGQPFETRLASPVFAQLVEGKDVWITTADGTRQRGKIAALTENGLILNGPEQTSLSLNQIDSIVEVSHRLRNGVVSGLVGGASVGLLTPLGYGCGGGSSVCGSRVLGLMAVGVGTGVAVAAVMNLDKNRDVLHDSGRKTRTVSFAPILSPKRKGMAFRMTWR